jgi:hypothetical protein
LHELARWPLSTPVFAAYVRPCTQSCRAGVFCAAAAEQLLLHFLHFRLTPQGGTEVHGGRTRTTCGLDMG